MSGSKLRPFYIFLSFRNTRDVFLRCISSRVRKKLCQGSKITRACNYLRPRPVARSVRSRDAYVMESSVRTEGLLRSTVVGRQVEDTHTISTSPCTSVIIALAERSTCDKRRKRDNPACVAIGIEAMVEQNCDRPGYHKRGKRHCCRHHSQP